MPAPRRNTHQSPLTHAPVDERVAADRAPERGEGDRDAEVHGEGGVEPEPEELGPGEAPVGGEAGHGVDDAGEVDVVAPERGITPAR